MNLILPVLAMLATAFATLTALVFCLGMGANAKPPTIRALKFWMAGIFLLGGAGIVVGFLLMRTGQTDWAAVAAFAPTVILCVILIVALRQ